MLVTAIADVSAGSLCFPLRSWIEPLPFIAQEELTFLRTSPESKTSRFPFACK